MTMKKYLLIQRSQRGGERQPPSPAQMQEMFAASTPGRRSSRTTSWTWAASSSPAARS